MTEPSDTGPHDTGRADTGPANAGPAADEAPERVERGRRVVRATPEAIFDLLADPAAHRLFDGSGSVRASADDAPDRLTLGARFGMRMRIGVPYRISNEVVEFEEGRLIAWRHFGGHVWRYVLEPVDGGTLVTEEFDWRPSRSPALLRLMRAPARNREAIEATLDRLAAHVEPPA